MTAAVPPEAAAEELVVALPPPPPPVVGDSLATLEDQAVTATATTVAPVKKSERRLAKAKRQLSQQEEPLSNSNHPPPSGSAAASRDAASKVRPRKRTARRSLRDADERRLVQPLLEQSATLPVTAADLVALASVWHPLPDTYSLAYAARLLGFAVPPALSATATLPVAYEPATLPLMREDSYLQIPPVGRFWEATATTAANRHASPDADDQARLDVLDPLYESLLGLYDDDDDDSNHFDPRSRRHTGRTRALTKVHAARLWDRLVEAATGAATTRPNAPTTTTVATASPCGWWETLQEIAEHSGQRLAVHALRPGAAELQPPLSTWNKGAGLNLPQQVPPHWMALVVSYKSQACGALYFSYEWCAAARTALVVRWHKVVLSQPPDALTAVALVALSKQHARSVQAHYGVYDCDVSAVTPLLDILQEAFRLVRLTLPAEEEPLPAQDSAEESHSNDREAAAMDVMVVDPPMPSNDPTKDRPKDPPVEGPAPTITPAVEEEKAIQLAPWTEYVVETSKPAGTENGFVPALPTAKPEEDKVELVSRDQVPVLSSVGRIRLVADLHKSSTRFAMLTWKRLTQEKKAVAVRPPADETKGCKYRAIIRLPNVEEATALVEGRPVKQKKLPASSSALSVFGSAAPPQRNITMRLQAVLQEDDTVQVFRVGDDDEKTAVETPDFKEDPATWQVFRTFPIPSQPVVDEEETDLVKQMKEMQKQVTQIEGGMESRLRDLMEQVVKERLDFETSGYLEKRDEEKRIMEENQKMLERRRAMDLEKQRRLEEDMEAVCCICNDGEVTPDNQIIFCESCDVPVHQMCYGIDKIPAEDYYCLACRYLDRNKNQKDRTLPKATSEELPVICSLCPHKGGALIRSNVPKKDDDTDDLGTWTHVVCAKWQGLDFVTPGKADLIEDFTDLRVSFRRLQITCHLCRGDRGCMNKCRRGSCDNWIHILCARSSGLCEVNHGEDCHGDVPDHPWTLLCPEHSGIKRDDVSEDATPVRKLVEMSRAFPPEPPPEFVPIAPMPFNTATREQRKLLLLDPKYEEALLCELLSKRYFGIRCEVCDVLTDVPKDLVRCSKCSVNFCHGCNLGSDVTQGNYRCPSCNNLESKNKDEDFEVPTCIACYQRDGPLRPAFAEPINKKSWGNKKEFSRTLYAKRFWAHTLCGLWFPALYTNEAGAFNFREVCTGRRGYSFVTQEFRCELCGQNGGLKICCDHRGCFVKHDGVKTRAYFHPTCARQAGLEVSEKQNGNHRDFYVRCYRHGGNEYNLRAHLEDMIELEKGRAGKTFARADNPMKFSYGCKLMHASIRTVKTLGWAWRWAEWWVDYNSRWEPLLEPGEKEEDMTQEELKIVESTRESRAADARLCRLSAFGATLRNRGYDVEDDFDRHALNRAFRSLLNTKSLVGPLGKYEIEFLADWLARAYKSKSRLLGFGDDKIEVAREAFCLHIEDETPKFELGQRPIPGKQILHNHEKFESGIEEFDDFLKTEVLEDVAEPPRATPPKKTPPKRKRDRRRRENGNGVGVQSKEMGCPPKKRGRPPKNRTADSVASTPMSTPVDLGRSSSLSKPTRLRRRLSGGDSLASTTTEGEVGDLSHASRPRKLRIVEGIVESPYSPAEPVRKRGRGRPRKIVAPLSGTTAEETVDLMDWKIPAKKSFDEDDAAGELPTENRGNLEPETDGTDGQPEEVSPVSSQKRYRDDVEPTHIGLRSSRRVVESAPHDNSASDGRAPDRRSSRRRAAQDGDHSEGDALGSLDEDDLPLSELVALLRSSRGRHGEANREEQSDEEDEMNSAPSSQLSPRTPSQQARLEGKEEAARGFR